MTPFYKFTSYPTAAMFDPQLLHETSIMSEATREEMFEAFQRFMEASGFHFTEHESIGIVHDSLFED
jgi:hypothetical protein